MVLWEKQIDFIDRPVDSTKREHLSDWYLKMNPHGVVPTLIHDDAVIIDSSVIIEYLDEAFTPISLTPSGSVGRAHMRKWLRFFEEVPTAAIRVPSFNQYLSKRFDKLSDEQFDEFVENHPMRREFYKKMRKEAGFDDQETSSALSRLSRTIAFMEKGIEKSGGPWLMGEQLTLADYCIAPTIDRMEDLGFAELWASYPLVSSWYEKIKSRDAYAKTYYAKTRLSEIYDGRDFGALPNSAQIKRD